MSEFDLKFIQWADGMRVPQLAEGRQFVGREEELVYCRAAWDMKKDGETDHYKLDYDAESEPLNFRLQGDPGVGKNELVYQLARELGYQEIYSIQGHEELSPEDLAVVIVPNKDASGPNDPPFVARASQLATALYNGGLFFFDEINRVPERSLAPLASVLEGRRRAIYSALTGLWIEE
ncbi:MAG: AAA family ATPase [Candidatus Binatia bacterium]